ncbi:MAG: hypothetical protein DCC51_05880 [Anaerolineae bacterium]|nr:MAG: hypothetical protein DCC51_05880 [Anaerolineae bacterium]
MRYAINRISPMRAMLYGLLLGLGIWIIPAIILGWLVRTTVLSLEAWLGGLRMVIPMPIGEGIAIDLTSALSLGDTQARLSALAGQDLALMLAIILGVAAAGMLFTGLAAFLSAIFYNLFAGVFGGIEVSLNALDVPDRRPVPAGVALPAAVPAAQAPPVAAPRPRVEQPRTGTPVAQAWLSPTSANGERRALLDSVTRIGSADGNDIILSGLAPQHAEIRREGGRYLIYDLGSRRTWVNDTQVAAVHMLKDGFRLQMGQSEFIVHIQTTNQAVAEAR